MTKVFNKEQGHNKCRICKVECVYRATGTAYYMVGKFRANLKYKSGSIVFCEKCWIEYSDLDIEDHYDIHGTKPEDIGET